jgi:HTH-type transcriptional regulator / antitoxin HigA
MVQVHARSEEVSNTLDIAAVASLWSKLEQLVGSIAPIRSDADFERLSSLLDELLDATRDGKSPSLRGLVVCVSELIAEYEDRVLPPIDGTPAELLALLIRENGLTQADLASELGGQSVVSQILSGKREINGRQAARLSARFGLAADAFLAVRDPAPAVPAAPQLGEESAVVLEFSVEATTAAKRLADSSEEGFLLQGQLEEFSQAISTSAGNPAQIIH